MAGHETDWIEGLRRGSGSSEGHRDGAALRAALREGLHDVQAPMSWQAFKVAAGNPSPAVLGDDRMGRGWRAMALARPVWALAAALLVAATVFWLRPPAPPAQDAMARGAGGALMAWPAADPQQAAREWSDRLQSEGLPVQRQLQGDCVLLQIQAKPEDAAKLLALEVSADAEGRAQIRICPSK